MSNQRKFDRHLHTQRCQITIYGRVDPSWSEWFSGLKVTITEDKESHPITHLTGTLPDQGALRGVLNKLWDLNLPLISVKCKKITVKEATK